MKTTNTNNTTVSLYAEIPVTAEQISAHLPALTVDRASVMRRAWEIRREAAERFGCSVTAIHWGECLRSAWAEVKAASGHTPAALAAAKVIAQWQSMSDVQQYAYCRGWAKKAAKLVIGRSVEDKYNRAVEMPAFYLYGYELDDYANETYCRLCEFLTMSKLTTMNEDKEKRGTGHFTLFYLAHRAGVYALQSIYRHEQKHGRAAVRTVTDDDGEEYSFVDTMVSAVNGNTEKEAIFEVMFSGWVSTLDDTNKEIVRLRLMNRTEREIGSALGMSGVAVHKRLDKMKKSWAQYAAA